TPCGVRYLPKPRRMPAHNPATPLRMPAGKRADNIQRSLMQLVATHTPTSGMATFDFTEPGGTIGRCPGNHLMLGDDASVGRVQAVVRIKDGHCSLMNVSSRTSMQLNGQALPLLQEAPIA